MIQIQRREQFTNAAARLAKERMSVRQHEPRLYEVTNKTKGHTYHVRIERKDGKTFGTCTCEAGTPHTGKRVPMVCKHLLAAVIFHRALYQMRRRATSH
jgi:lipoprotein-anchoring transpeptidase ErfK/SrfK